MRKIVKHSREDLLEHSADDLRWATSEEVADYRAERLKCKRIVDVGCGIGLQSFSFASTCEQVFAIDINEEKIIKARKNALALEIKNVEFMNADVMDVTALDKIKAFKPDIIFLDPDRPENESVREISSIKPDLNQFLSQYSQVTNKIAIELPPQINEISFDGEREYLSINGELRRLTIYTGDLKKAARSAISLPSRSTLFPKQISPAEKKSVGTFLFEVDPAVVKANLVADLCNDTKTWIGIEAKHLYLSSTKKIANPFFKNSYRIFDRVPFEELAAWFRKSDAGKVILRYSIDPAQYWRERSLFEHGLKGSKIVYVFKVDEQALLCETA